MVRTEESKIASVDSGAGNRMDWVVYILIRSIIAIIGWAPGILARGICEICALLVYAIDRKHRKIGLVNLGIAFPDRDERWRKRVLRSSFRRIADHFVELSRLPGVDPEDIRLRVQYEPGRGLEHYAAAKKQGKGVLFLTGHISAWELLPLAHAVLGSPLNVVVRKLDNPLLDRWMTRTRSRFGNSVIYKESSLRMILRLLSEGKDVGLLIDQNVQEKDGVFVPLFQHQACTAVSPAALALRTGSPVVCGFLIPTRRKRHYKIRFYPAVELEASQDREADLAKYTSLFNRFLEDVITENPDCWLWGHRRFGTQADGRDLYKED